MSQKRHIFLGSSLGLLLRVAGALLAIAVQVLVARTIGKDAFGAYSYVISWLAVLAVLSSLGFGSSIPRFLPVMLAKNQLDQYKGTLIAVVSLPLVLSLVITGAFLLVIHGLEAWAGTPYRDPLTIGLLALPALSLARVRRASVLALKRVLWADLPDMVVRPVFYITLLWVVGLVGITIGAPGAILLFASAVYASFLLGFFVLWRMQPAGISEHRPTFLWRDILVISAPMYLMESLSTLIGEFAVIALGWTGDPDSVAVFAVATRLTLLIGFALQAANSVLNPMISELYHDGKKKQLQDSLSFAARILTLVTIVMAGVLIFGGRYVLDLFGPGFSDGYVLLQVLLVGQCVNALCGSVGSIMKMTGHQNQSCVIMVVAMLVNIGLCFLLIPRYDAMGAAIAVAVSLSIWNLIMVIYCLSVIGLNPTVFPLPVRNNGSE